MGSARRQCGYGDLLGLGVEQPIDFAFGFDLDVSFGVGIEYAFDLAFGVSFEFAVFDVRNDLCQRRNGAVKARSVLQPRCNLWWIVFRWMPTTSAHSVTHRVLPLYVKR
jgi:hypothetical protein